jgi:hypothetical protein
MRQTRPGKRNLMRWPCCAAFSRFVAAQLIRPLRPSRMWGESVQARRPEAADYVAWSEPLSSLTASVFV